MTHTGAPRPNFEDRGDPVMGQQADFERMLAEGSTALHRALWQQHAGILQALERQGQGRVVVRP